MSRVAAIIPAYNEAERIAATVEAAHHIPGVDELIVVDDGSLDRTAAQAETGGATVVRLPARGGKGAALNAGVRTTAANILLLLDADLGDTAGQAEALLPPVLRGEADMAIARFASGAAKGGGFGLVVKLARWGIRRYTGREMVSPLSGQRALRREVWEKLGGFAPGFSVETALTIDALRASFTVIEVPVRMTHRVTGRDLRGILHRAKQLLAVAAALWARR